MSNTRKVIKRITFSADLITANKVDITINTVGMTQVPFNTSSSQTIDDVCTQLVAMGSTTIVDQAQHLNGTRTILIQSTTAASSLNITVATVTGGASQAGITIDDSDGGFRQQEQEATPIQSFTSSVETGSTNSPILAGARQVIFTTNSSFAGTINGATAAVSTTYRFGDTIGGSLPAIAYTVSAGSVRIDTLS